MVENYDKALTREVKAYAKKLGADLVGIADAKLLENPIPGQGHVSPNQFIPGAKAIVVLGLRHIDAFFHPEYPNGVLFHNIYALEHDHLIDQLNVLGYRIARFLQKKKWNSVSMPSSDFFIREKERIPPTFERIFHAGISHRYAAYCAGLGEFGVNSVILTPEYGPKQRWNSVITDAPLEPGKPYKGKVCTRCQKCIEICPSGAITKKVDPSDAKNIYKNFDDWKCMWGVTRLDHPDLPKNPPPNMKIDEIDKIRGPRTNNRNTHSYCALCIKVCEAGKAAERERLSSPNKAKLLG